MVGNTRQLKLGADRARQRSDMAMEMLDGTEVVRAMAGADAETGADGSGLVVEAAGGGRMIVTGMSGTSEIGWHALGWTLS